MIYNLTAQNEFIIKQNTCKLRKCIKNKSGYVWYRYEGWFHEVAWGKSASPEAPKRNFRKLSDL